MANYVRVPGLREYAPAPATVLVLLRLRRCPSLDFPLAEQEVYYQDAFRKCDTIFSNSSFVLKWMIILPAFLPDILISTFVPTSSRTMSCNCWTCAMLTPSGFWAAPFSEGFLKGMLCFA